MANTPKKHPSGRRRKQTKTIDLEANPVPEESDADTVSAEMSKAETTSSKDAVAGKAAEDLDTGSADTDTSDNTEDKPVFEEAGAAKPMPKPGGGSSIGSILLSGVVGGAVVLGGAGIMNSAGYLQSVPIVGGLFGASGTSGELEAANQKIADLSARLDELASGRDNSDASLEITRLSEKIGVVEAKLAESGEGNAAASIQTAEKALAAALAASQKAEETSGKIAELSSKIVESGGGASVDMEAVKAALSGESEALAQRIAAVESQLGENGSGVGGLSGELEAIKEQLTDLKKSGDNVSAIEGKVGEMANGLDEVAKKIGSIDERLGAVETSVNENILPSMGQVEKAAIAAIESQKVARSVSARALGNVLEQGGKFTSELAAAEALAGASEAITQLKPLAENGIRTDAELLAGFEAVSDQILAAEAGKASGEGILDKFMASAKTLVKVRPSGPVSGDSTTAILSRIEAALKSGDLATVKSELGGLNEAAKDASSDWARAVDERMKAKTLIETVIGELSAEQNGQG